MVHRLLFVFFCGFLNVIGCAASDEEKPTGIKIISLVSEGGEETVFSIPCGTRKGLKDFFEANGDCDDVRTLDLSSNSSSLTLEGVEDVVSWLSDEGAWPCLKVLNVDKVVPDPERMCLFLPLLKRLDLLIYARKNVSVGSYAELYEQAARLLEPTEEEIELRTEYGDSDADTKKKAIQDFYLNRFVCS
jgi:hypothetical protein